MKIYTRTGDKGKTSLLGGTRVSKSHLKIQAYGTIDEFNSYLGLLADQPVNKNRVYFLRKIQDLLFTIGSILAKDPNKPKVKTPQISKKEITILEKEIDLLSEKLPEMKNFILPGGHQSVSICHITRCVCRRAERLVIELDQTEKLDDTIIKYLNRLSDYLFVLARKMSSELSVNEIPWKPKI